ncbi:MAG: DUF362 domain-containing protein [Polyangiaceae bacterium]
MKTRFQSFLTSQAPRATRTTTCGALILGLLASMPNWACQRSRSQSGAAPKPSSSAAALGLASATTTPPDVISHASEYHGGPPVRVAETVDGAALRKRHIERLKNDRSAVTVLKGESALELGERICRAVVPMRPKWTPIVIKPNICGFDGFKNPEKTGGDDGANGRVTDAEFVRGVVRCLVARGHDEITIAEGCGNSHAHWQKAIAVTGFEAMAREEHVPLVALDDDGVYDKVGEQPGKPLAIRGIERTHVPTLLMPKLLSEVLEHGMFISVPKLKAHRYSVVSLGIKGMQGTVMRSEATPAYNQKWRMHEELNQYTRARAKKEPEDRAKYVDTLERFAERMVDVLEISLPDVVLVDGAPAIAGDGFQKIRKLPGMLAIGGTNPVLVDRVGSEYLRLWNNSALAAQLGGHGSSPLIEIAARRYGVDWKTLTLTGDGIERLKSPPPVFYKAIAPFILDGATQPPGDANHDGTAQPDASHDGTSHDGTSHDGTSHDGTAEPGANPKADAFVAQATRASHRPNIDGRIDRVWGSVNPVVWTTDYAGKDTQVITRARFLWDETGLFVLFELFSTDLNVDVSRPLDTERLKLYEEDCVELFLAPNRAEPNHYYEVEMGPFGHWMDVEVDRARKREDVAWSSQIQIATKRNPKDHIAIIEARLAAPEIIEALRVGARLPLALYRMDGKSPRKYLAWRPPRTKKPNFHVPEGFGTLVLD